MSDSAESYRDLGRRLSNWGRWGDDDESGTLNLLTEECRVAAAALVESGEMFDLGIPLDEHGPQTGGTGRQNPLHIMTRTPLDPPASSGFHYFDDALFAHLQSATQLDGLAHVAYDGELYNGVPVEAVSWSGAARLGMQHYASRIQGRGVLLDLPRLGGRARLDAAEPVTAADLDRAVQAEGVEIRSGDILFVRTGWITVFSEDRDREAFFATEPGLALDAAEWLRERDIAFVAADNWGVEVAPAPDGSEMPLHCVLIRDLGMPLGEMLDLEAAAAHADSTGRWEFQATCLALPVTGGIGSILLPTVTF
ncbi:cyclase family protein [Leucobacter weissii]|uniref:Cyclase family protein n=1 Tax=Leucobacter weissii TaxID=1983706 RepID=A0A939MI41_9MICO|nr:cyclase family protein [Leucobacter weissii]MBO1900435.1 cyclase family protein [Leucobacter weissii]